MTATETRRAVRILNHDGSPLYNRLYDDGSLVLTFESGFGFVDRLDVKRFGWHIVAGWTVGSEEPFLTEPFDIQRDWEERA